MSKFNELVENVGHDVFPRRTLRHRAGLGVIKVVNHLATFIPDVAEHEAPRINELDLNKQKSLGTVALGVVVGGLCYAANEYVAAKTGQSIPVHIIESLNPSFQ